LRDIRRTLSGRGRMRLEGSTTYSALVAQQWSYLRGQGLGVKMAVTEVRGLSQDVHDHQAGGDRAAKDTAPTRIAPGRCCPPAVPGMPAVIPTRGAKIMRRATRNALMAGSGVDMPTSSRAAFGWQDPRLRTTACYRWSPLQRRRLSEASAKRRWRSGSVSPNSFAVMVASAASRMLA
jgi:hypothetical protein